MHFKPCISIIPVMPMMPMMQTRERCPICRSTSFACLYREPYSGPGIKKYLDAHYEGRATDHADGYDYELVQCRDCGFTYQTHVPADSLLSEIYDAWIPKSELERIRSSFGLDDYRYFSEQIQFVIQHFQLPPHLLNILDFGFGWAEWSRMAMAYGCNVTGAELSQERIDYARSIGLAVAVFPGLPEKKFHFINTEQVFEHLVEPREVLQGLACSLADDGVIKISVPNSKASIQKIRQAKEFSSLSPIEIMPIAPLEHVNSFDYDSLIALGSAVGLKPLRPSLYKLYNSCSGCMDIKNASRLFARQLYRHVFPKSTFLYFTHA